MTDRETLAARIEVERAALQGAVCFPQRFLIAARAALNDPKVTS